MLKKIFLVISIFMTGVGIFLIISGNINEEMINSGIYTIDVFDPECFKPGVYGSICVDPETIFKEQEGLFTFDAYGESEDQYSIIPLIGYKKDSFRATVNLTNMDADGNLRFFVSVEECPAETREQVINGLVDYYKMLYEYEAAKGDSADPRFLEYYSYLCGEEGHETFDSYVSHYQCKITSGDNSFLFKTAGIIMTPIGALILLVSLLCFKFPAKKAGKAAAAVFFITLLLITAIILIITRKKLSTMASVKKYADGFYTARCSDDYKLDELLDADVSNENELISWISDNLYYGIPITAAPGVFGCSAFSVCSPEGHYLMGRNYDYPETDCLMLYCSPENGYASMGMVDLSFLNLGTLKGQTPPDSFTGRIPALILPYATVDGVNEAGLAISILQLNEPEIHQDMGRKDIILTVAIRAVLDKCASVEEATALLDLYDMHSMLEQSSHFFITDKNGNSVVVEWINDEMTVTENPAVTNYVLSDPHHYEDNSKNGSDGRYEILMEDIAACSGRADRDKAMIFLSEASDNPDRGQTETEWSVVYDLDAFDASICTDMDYENTYIITPAAFGVKR
jgi:hypothetical protein